MDEDMKFVKNTNETYVRINKETKEEEEYECITKDEIEMFVVKNKAELQKEFTIGFGIKTKEQYEIDETKARETLSKKD